MTEATLSAKVTADIADFTKKFAQMHDEIAALGDGTVASSGKTASAVEAATGGSMKRMSEQAKFVATSMVGVATAVEGTFFGIAKAVSASTEQIQQIAEQTGMSASSLEQWQPILARTNTSIQTFATSYRALSKDILEAQNGQQGAIEKFAEMGLSVQQLSSTDAVIAAIADRIASIENPAQRAQLAVDLLGRGGLALIPSLRGGSQALRESGQQARDWGLALTEVQRNDLLRFDDALDDLGSSFGGLKTQVAIAAVPALQAISSMVQGAIGWFGKLDGGVKQIVSVFGTAFATGGPVVLAAAGAAAALGFAFAPILIGGATVVALIAAVTLIIANWQKIKDTGTAIWTGAKTAVVAAAKGLYDGLIEWLVNKPAAIGQKVMDVAKGVARPFEWLKDHLVTRSVVPDMIREIEASMDQLPSKMIPQARAAVTRVKNIFAELAAIQTSPGSTSGLSGQVQSFNIDQSSAQRAALANTIQSIETGKFTFIQAQNQMASVAVQTWGGISSTVSGAFASQLISGNNWVATLNQLGTTVLSNFTNMAIQMATQWVASLATRTAADAVATSATVASTALQATAVTSAAGVMAASNVAAATASVSVWAGASAAIVGFFGLVSAGFAAIAASLVISVIAVGTFIMGVLGAIGTALAATVFGIPYLGAILVGIAAIAVALALTDNLPGFAKGGISFGPAVFGEAGPEAAIPLNSRGASFMQSAFGVGSGGGGGGTPKLIIQLDGRELTRHVMKHLPGLVYMKTGLA